MWLEITHTSHLLAYVFITYRIVSLVFPPLLAVNVAAVSVALLLFIETGRESILEGTSSWRRDCPTLVSLLRVATSSTDDLI